MLYSVVKESHLRGLYTVRIEDQYSMNRVFCQHCYRFHHTRQWISPSTTSLFAIPIVFLYGMPNISLVHNSFMNSINGFFSGSLAKMVVYPLDTIKKQMQVCHTRAIISIDAIDSYDVWTFIHEIYISTSYIDVQKGRNPSVLFWTIALSSQVWCQYKYLFRIIWLYFTINHR